MVGYGNPPRGVPWVPGQSGNLNGRPSDAKLKEALRKHEPGAVDELVRLALHGKREATRLRALEIFFERLYGKVTVPVDVRAIMLNQMVNLPREQLLALDAELAAQEVIDHAEH